MKKTKIDKAIDALEAEITVRQFAIAKLKEQIAITNPVTRKKPKLVGSAVNE